MGNGKEKCENQSGKGSKKSGTKNDGNNGCGQWMGKRRIDVLKRETRATGEIVC